MKVLVVDDSATFRTQIRRALQDVPDVEVAGAASNGKIALQMIQQKSVDLVTLDLNMPEMDGLETLQEIKKIDPSIHVIIFASGSSRSARDTIKALGLGATDFVLKPDGETFSVENAFEQVRDQLVPRIMNLKPKSVARPLMQNSSFQNSQQAVSSGGSGGPITALLRLQPKVVVIASSTGGPNALEAVFRNIRGPLRVPILIAQHMPETFTAFLAKRLGDICKVACAEGVHGELLTQNRVYVAPGNRHMRLVRDGAQVKIAIDEGPKRHNVRPAADFLFETAADIYGEQCLGIVLTGMGEDGAEGSHRVKQFGGKILIQDKESCVVWGMPAAVHRAGLHDAEGNLEDIGRLVHQLTAMEAAA